MSARKIVLIVICHALFYVTGNAQANYRLWYEQPATTWTEALPLGNGYLGAMVFGKVEDELIQLNESTLWSGGPVKKDINPDAPKYLLQIRNALLKEEDYEKARSLTQKMQGFFSESYMPMGDLLIKQQFNGAAPSSYNRELNIKDAVNNTTWVINGVAFKREIFISAPDRVMVIRLSADKKGQLNFDVTSRSQLHYQLVANDGNQLILKGKAPAHADPNYHNREGQEPVIYEDTTGCNGMRFQFRIQAINTGGTVSADTSGIHIKYATEVLLLVTAATSFNGYDKCPDKDGKDENELARSYMDHTKNKSFQNLLNNHLADFHQ